MTLQEARERLAKRVEHAAKQSETALRISNDDWIRGWTRGYQRGVEAALKELDRDDTEAK